MNPFHKKETQSTAHITISGFVEWGNAAHQIPHQTAQVPAFSDAPIIDEKTMTRAAMPIQTDKDGLLYFFQNNFATDHSCTFIEMDSANAIRHRTTIRSTDLSEVNIIDYARGQNGCAFVLLTGIKDDEQINCLIKADSSGKILWQKTGIANDNPANSELFSGNFTQLLLDSKGDLLIATRFPKNQFLQLAAIDGALKKTIYTPGIMVTDHFMLNDADCLTALWFDRSKARHRIGIFNPANNDLTVADLDEKLSTTSLELVSQNNQTGIVCKSIYQRKLFWLTNEGVLQQSVELHGAAISPGRRDLYIESREGNEVRIQKYNNDNFSMIARWTASEELNNTTTLFSVDATENFSFIDRQKPSGVSPILVFNKKGELRQRLHSFDSMEMDTYVDWKNIFATAHGALTVPVISPGGTCLLNVSLNVR